MMSVSTEKDLIGAVMHCFYKTKKKQLEQNKTTEK